MAGSGDSAHTCASIGPFNLIASSPQAIAGEIGMDNVLDNIANSLFNGLLPGAWSKLAPATCKQLASWLEHLRVSRVLVLHHWQALGQLINQLSPPNQSR